MKRAFTLSEVLITLGIIGVVSAMTLPTLIQNYRNHVAETRLKKFYSTFNQAIQRSVVENGDFENWEYFDGAMGNLDSEVIKERFNIFIRPYLNITAEKDITSKNGRNYIVYYLPDGSAFAYNANHIRDIFYFPKNPNKCLNEESLENRGSSYFNFVFMPVNNSEAWELHYNKGLEANMYNWDKNIENLYRGKSLSCEGNIGNYCTAIIQLNGWKIPKDYPRKIKF